MKKIITLFVLFFAFSINASAQDKSIEFEISAKKDLELLISVVPVDNNMQMAFYELFKKKHTDLAAPEMTQAKRIEISSIIDAKLRASLTNDQTISLEKNPAVYAQLIAKVPSTEKAKKK
ncbi:hypothetical protein [Flavobacterium limnosediminis]|nr:hypothetical protein [Flavobacterium limnosediminis]